MSTQTSYPVRLEKKIIAAVRPIAKREGRTIKGQLEKIISAAINAERSTKMHISAHAAARIAKL